MEIDKWRHLVAPYCTGNGVDIGSQGFPVVPHAIQVELTEGEFARYTSGAKPGSPIQWRGDGRVLPFKDGVLDFCFSSNLIEDFLDWVPILQEWGRVVKLGGYLVIMVPEKARWHAALRRGQPPNCAHKHEAYVGELSTCFDRLFWDVIRDSLADPDGDDYNIIFCARRK